jgi:hypothetical protein
MSRRYWLSLIAVVGLISAVGAQQAHETQGKAPRSAVARQTPQTQPQPTVPLTLQNSVDGIRAALEAANKKQDTSEEKRKSEEDRQAQLSMARSAQQMFYVGLAETIITFIGVMLVLATLLYTKQAAEAARDAVGEAKRAADLANAELTQSGEQAKRELRAYISVEPLGVSQLIGRHLFAGTVLIKNVGKIPASNIYVRGRVDLSPTSDFAAFSPDNDIPTKQTIQPGVSIIRFTPQTLVLRDILAEPEGYIFAWGIVRYDDGFGTRRYTRFCHRYAIASHDRAHDYHVAATSARYLLEAEKARYYQGYNDSD